MLLIAIINYQKTTLWWWWWSNGQIANLLLRQPEIGSCRSLFENNEKEAGDDLSIFKNKLLLAALPTSESEKCFCFGLLVVTFVDALSFLVT